MKTSRPGVVALAFNPSTWDVESDGFLSSRPAWSTKWVPGQPGRHKYKKKKYKKKKKKKKESWYREILGSSLLLVGHKYLVLKEQEYVFNW
jgi:hypothetical protein